MAVAERLLLVLMLAILPIAVGQARPLALLPPDAQIVEQGAVSAVSKQAAEQHARHARTALSLGDDAGALAALQGSGDALAFESTATELIAELVIERNSGLEEAAAERLLQRLAVEPVRVFRRHEETAAHWFLPLFDVGAQARSALATREHARNRAQWQARLEHAPAEALDALSLVDDGASDAAAHAVAALSPGSAQALLAAARSMPQPPPSSLLRALAERLLVGEAFALAAQHASDADLLRLIPASAALSETEALRWLDGVGERPALASAALMALAPRAERGSVALERLLGMLAHPALGDSAAAALATRDAPDRVAVLEAAGGDASPLALVNIVLALRLIASAEADRVLAGLRHDARLPAATREELAR